MRIQIGSFDQVAQHLPTLERICDLYGGSIQITGDGVVYEAPVLLAEVAQVLTPIAEKWSPELRQAA